MKNIKNIGASVRQRLLDIQHREGRAFGELLQYFAMERFLYRLSKSKHSELFILKGALMLRVWGAPQCRPTMDIDMLGITRNEPIQILGLIKDILAVEIGPDGFPPWFD